MKLSPVAADKKIKDVLQQDKRWQNEEWNPEDQQSALTITHGQSQEHSRSIWQSEKHGVTQSNGPEDPDLAKGLIATVWRDHESVTEFQQGTSRGLCASWNEPLKI